MGDSSDGEVMVASAAEPDLFGVIFDRHGPPVLRYLSRRVGPNEAEALLGDVFRIAFERRQDFEAERQSALPWLYGIAANLLRRHRRSQLRRLRAVGRLGPTAGSAGLEEAVVSAVDAAALLPQVVEALSSLTPDDRETLLLYAWENFEYGQIAEILSIPLGTVRSRIHRARERLREHLGPSGEEGDIRGGAQ